MTNFITMPTPEDFAVFSVDRLISADRFENNDTAATATNLQTISGTHTETSLSIEANDPDWYKFTLGSTGRTGDKVTISFLHSLGDLDLSLYNSTGTTLLDSSLGVGNQESISLARLTAGDYLVKVVGYAGASNSDYTLTLNAAVSAFTGDRFENNDTAATATNLQTISGTHTETSLSIEANDPDWYKFTLGSAGRAGDKVAISFLHSLGDLDLSLYNSTGTTLLNSSLGVGNQESISFAGLSAGDYLVKVEGYAGASNSNYTLTLNAAVSQTTGDRFEENDTAATATNLRTISGITTETALSIEANDPDWYKFTLGSAGRAGDKVAISFLHSLGDLDLSLYNSTGTTLLNSSLGVGNQESISFAGLSAGDYLVKVEGYAGASNSNYTLTLNAAVSQTTGDRFEENDTAATATNLRTISGITTETALSIEANDPDWYKFTLGSAGRAGDKVAISFLHSLGDLDLSLYNSTGTTLLNSSLGVGNQESISFAGLSAGDYLVKVEGYAGASNSDYTLTLNAAVSQTTGDRFEENDTAATATNLRTISGITTETALSIEANDPDWYRFTLGSAAQTGDKVTISFLHSLGDLDLSLYNSTGTTLLNSSLGVGNQESVSLSGLVAGDYLVKVAGYAGASNSNYNLTLSTHEVTQLSPDAWEANNSLLQATDIRDTAQVISNATITPADQDWYHFSLSSTGLLSNMVSLSERGDPLQLSLYNAQSELMATQSTSSAQDVATLSFQGMSAGDYYLKVSGVTESSQSTYDLSLNTIPSPDNPGPDPVTNEIWTILVYVNGDNNLEPYAISDINEMEAATRRAGINVGVMVDRISGYDSSNGNWTDTRRGVIVSDNNTSIMTTQLQSIGEANLGATQTLTDFINWGSSNLPADHYAVVVWNHGGGTLYGASFDDSSSGQSLSLANISQAVGASTLQYVDLLGYDACLMSSIEAAGQISSYASVLVASEVPEPGDGWDYTSFLSEFSASSDTSVQTLATAMVTTYGTSYSGSEPLSAIDLADVAALQSTINIFVSTMQTASTSDWNAVKNALAQSQTVGDSYGQGSDLYVDLGSFMSQLVLASSNPLIDSAAQLVINAIQTAIIRKAGPSSYTGLTVVFPATATASTIVNQSGYDATHFSFLQQTTWDDFLSMYSSHRSLSASRAFGDELLPDFAETLNLSALHVSFNNNTLGTSLDLGTIGRSDFTLSNLSIDSALDVDCFRFSLPENRSQGSEARILFSHAAGDLKLSLYDSQQTLLATVDSKDDNESLSLDTLQPNQQYFLKAEGVDGVTNSHYSLLINALGGSSLTLAPSDFAENNGGNNSIEKAWLLGDASSLELLGKIENLSFDSADVASGSDGGDWFRVQSTRLTDTNANHVQLSSSGTVNGDIDLFVYDIGGNLLASTTTLTSSEEVFFLPQVEDIFIQVLSKSGSLNSSYSLSIEGDGVADTTAPTVATFSPADASSGVAVGSDLVLIFSETIQQGSGTIVIHSGSATGTPVATYDAATSPNLTVSGNTLTINPTDNFAYSTHYFVTLDSGSIQDLAGNSYAGTSSYDFFTAYSTPLTPITAGSIESWEYFASYSDLRGWAMLDGVLDATDSDNSVWHYNTQVVSGIESRSITFNAWKYLASNVDLMNWLVADGLTDADAVTAAKHYIEHGIDEGRPMTFNSAAYLAANEDLIAWLGATNYDAAAKHYIEFGRFEGRPDGSSSASLAVAATYEASTATIDLSGGMIADQVALSGIVSSSQLPILPVFDGLLCSN